MEGGEEGGREEGGEEGGGARGARFKGGAVKVRRTPVTMELRKNRRDGSRSLGVSERPWLPELWIYFKVRAFGGDMKKPPC